MVSNIFELCTKNSRYLYSTQLQPVHVLCGLHLKNETRWVPKCKKKSLSDRKTFPFVSFFDGFSPRKDEHNRVVRHLQKAFMELISSEFSCELLLVAQEFHKLHMHSVEIQMMCPCFV